MDPWITATDVLADRAFCNLDLEDEDLVDRATDAAAAASEILSRESGYTIRGVRTVTVWPRTTEAWDPTVLVRPFQSSYPTPCPVTEITLEWPVVAIVSVTVDGDTLVAGTDYRVENDRFLVRLPDDGQQRYWPYSWVNNGDFTVTYQWGVNPEPWMKDAALEVAVALLREDVSSVPALAAGVDSVNQQGTSFRIGRGGDSLRERATPDTFPHLVRFLKLVNPSQETMPTYAWSPDLGHELRST